MPNDPLKLIPLVVYVGAFACLIAHVVTFEQFIVTIGLAATAHAGISTFNNKQD